MNRQQVVIIVAAALVFCGLCFLGTAILLNSRTGQLVVSQVAPEVAATSAPRTNGGQVTPVPARPPSSGLNEEGFRGPTTREAKSATMAEVQRLRTEASAFVRRIVPMTENWKCPKGWVCTMHLANDTIKVFVGDDVIRVAKAATFRFIAAYPSNDAVHGNPPCELLAKEQRFGAGEDPSFPVSAGNFQCAGSYVAPSDSTSTNVVNCPSFSGVALRPLADGGCKYGPSTVTTASVPAGWWVNYWDGSQTRTAQSGQPITTGEATFYQNGK